MAFGPKRLLPTQMGGTLWDPPGPLVGTCSGNGGKECSPCLLKAAAGFLMTPGCPVPTLPPQAPGRKPSLDGKEEMPSLPENHPSTSVLGLNPGKNIRPELEV